jgi:hypothetical protein
MGVVSIYIYSIIIPLWTICDKKEVNEKVDHFLFFPRRQDSTSSETSSTTIPSSNNTVTTEIFDESQESQDQPELHSQDNTRSNYVDFKSFFETIPDTYKNIHTVSYKVMSKTYIPHKNYCQEYWHELTFREIFAKQSTFF